MINTDNLIYFYLTVAVLILALVIGIYVANQLDLRDKRKKKK